MDLMDGVDLKKIEEKMNCASGAELKVLFFLSEGYVSLREVLSAVSNLLCSFFPP